MISEVPFSSWKCTRQSSTHRGPSLSQWIVVFQSIDSLPTSHNLSFIWWEHRNLKIKNPEWIDDIINMLRNFQKQVKYKLVPEFVVWMVTSLLMSVGIFPSPGIKHMYFNASFSILILLRYDNHNCVYKCEIHISQEILQNDHLSIL